MEWAPTEEYLYALQHECLSVVKSNLRDLEECRKDCDRWSTAYVILRKALGDVFDLLVHEEYFPNLLQMKYERSWRQHRWDVAKEQMKLVHWTTERFVDGRINHMTARVQVRNVLKRARGEDE